MTCSDSARHTSDGTFSIKRSRRSQCLAAALLVLTALAAFTSAPATAAISDEEELTRFGSFGVGPGQLQFPEGVATDPTTGHVFVTEVGGGNRISEFNPWGDFVKAFGWDVAPGAVNEQQEVRVRASTGQFKITFGASTTSDLAFNAPGSESEGPGSVEAALNGLPSIGGAGGEVNVQAAPGTSDGQTPFIYVVAFKDSLAATDVAQLTIEDGATPTSGGVPSTNLEVRTRADGHAAMTSFEACTAESDCKAAVGGSGAGQFARARGIAVDTDSNVYVREVDNRRVQKFDSAGRFVWMAGGEVNKNTGANLCTAASGDECGIGVAGAAQGQFGSGNSGGIANCSGTLFVADRERIQRFNLKGEFEAELPVPGEVVSRVACDPVSSDLYATFEAKTNVRKLDATMGEQVDEIEVDGLTAIATDLSGNLFAVSGRKVLEFDFEGKPLSPSSCCETASLQVGGLGINPLGTFYVSYGSVADSFIRSFGPAPVSFEAAPKVPPTITAQFASSVGRNDATVTGEINPHFWSDTTYQVEYGTGKCSEGGCTEKRPVSAAILSSKAIDAPLKSAGVFLEGLEAGAIYHYRFVAESTGGGPVYGIDPDGEGSEEASPTEGLEGTFTTFPNSTPPKICTNDLSRLGPATRLPDCRAYEMVSPVDKNNGDIRSLLSPAGYTTALSQSATDGSRFTYSSYRSFADSDAAAYTSQYLAKRDPVGGWGSEALDVAQAAHFNIGGQPRSDALENHAKAFTPDLCQSWLMLLADPPAAPGAPDGFRSVYRRDNCGGGGLEALVQVLPSSLTFYPFVQGTSADGSEALLRANDPLTPGAPDVAWQAYYASDGELSLLCYLPSGLPSTGNCSGGTSVGSFPASVALMERLSSLTNALSADGSKAYWTDSGANEEGPGKIYLRLNPGEEQSNVEGGVCTEFEKACTLRVSETGSNGPSRFLWASADGTKALYEVTAGSDAGKLYLFSLETETSTLMADESLGVAGASENLARIYFFSEEALAGDAVSGQPNLYLDEGGVTTFVATLGVGEAGSVGENLTNSNSRLIYHAARATPDGRALTFVSRRNLTGYDNTDLSTGQADLEVYLYEVGAAEPVCVSCNPSGARPLGRVVSEPPQVTGQIAAWLAMPDNALYTPRALSNDGQKLFFNSFDALLPRDTNGKADVYQWQKAQDQKACDKAGAELYVPSSGGCISLISTGQGPQDSELLDISANGKDAFFTTNARLLPQDPGLVDVYDARANGGLPIPPGPPGPCQGEACQSATTPPNDPTPASASFKGAGNLSFKPRPRPRPRCSKGKARRSKGRCPVRRKGAQKHRQNRSTDNRRTNR